MSKSGTDPKLVEETLASVRETIQSEYIDVEKGRARLFSRIPDPANLPAEVSYAVDLERAWFDHTFKEDPVSFGPLQVISIFTVTDGDQETGQFQWGWKHGDIPEEAVGDVEDFIHNMPALESLLALGDFTCSYEMAQDLCDYIAVQSGFLGCYPAIQENSVIFIAVKLSVESEDNFEFGQAGNFWCLNCGWAQAAAPKMVTGKWGGLCIECAPALLDTIRDIEAVEDEEEAEEDATSEQYECFLCGQTGSKEQPLVYMTYTAVHGGCVEVAVSEMIPAGPSA